MLEVLKPDLKPTDVSRNLFSDFSSFPITPRNFWTRLFLWEWDKSTPQSNERTLVEFTSCGTKSIAVDWDQSLLSKATTAVRKRLYLTGISQV